MTKKKLRQYLATVTVTVALVITIGAFSKAFSNLDPSYPTAPVSAELKSLAERSNMSSEELGATCQPEGATNLVLVAEATKEHTTFQVWHMNINGQLVERTTSLFGTACGLANDSRYFRFPYEYVPRAVAEKLASQSLKYNIDSAGGLEAYRADLIEHLQPDGLSGDTLPRFSEIDVEAWEKAGLAVPSNLYEVIEYQETKPYEF